MGEIFRSLLTRDKNGFNMFNCCNRLQETSQVSNFLEYA